MNLINFDGLESKSQPNINKYSSKIDSFISWDPELTNRCNTLQKWKKYEGEGEGEGKS